MAQYAANCGTYATPKRHGPQPATHEELRSRPTRRPVCACRRTREPHGDRPIDRRADRQEHVLLAHHRHQRREGAQRHQAGGADWRRMRSHVRTNAATANAEQACDIGGAMYM